MNLRCVPLCELRPAPYNPRKPLKKGSPGYRRLERSLAEFDLVQPIVWNEQTGHVVGGHQRLQILRDQGVAEIEVVVVALSLPREKALNIALNNPQVGSEFDPGKLGDLLQELEALPEFDATLTGFDPQDLKHMHLVPEPLPSEARARVPADRVRVELQLPVEHWADFRCELDALLGRFPLELHVQHPPGDRG